MTTFCQTNLLFAFQVARFGKEHTVDLLLHTHNTSVQVHGRSEMPKQINIDIAGKKTAEIDIGKNKDKPEHITSYKYPRTLLGQ